MNQFPTSKENIVINLLYEWLGERRYNRTMSEYLAVAYRLPKTEALHSYVNQRLREMAEARPYFTGNKDLSPPFNPIIEVDRSRVMLDEFDEFRLEGAYAMNWANGVCRWRRQRAFEWRRGALHETLPVIVAEGDSWFQFPILLADVVDQFDSDYYVWCVSAAGDTLENMVNSAPEYLEAISLHGPRPKVFLFSGAGNDFVGEEPDGTSVLFRVLRDHEPGRPAAWYLQTDAFLARLAFIERAYGTVLESVEREFGGQVSVICHGYDHAIPWGGAGDPRNPIWAAKDGWLSQPLRARNITDHQLQREIIALLIDKLNELLIRQCGGNNSGGVFKHAYHADVRGTLPNVTDWADELHPTNSGFARVAKKMAPLLAELMR